MWEHHFSSGQVGRKLNPWASENGDFQGILQDLLVGTWKGQCPSELCLRMLTGSGHLQLTEKWMTIVYMLQKMLVAMPRGREPQRPALDYSEPTTWPSAGPWAPLSHPLLLDTKFLSWQNREKCKRTWSYLPKIWQEQSRWRSQAETNMNAFLFYKNVKVSHSIFYSFTWVW